MGLPIWGDLDRAVNDSTKIDAAIATAVAAHNDDEEAHLGDGQSLESHRAAEIIDHLAESVVNDKLATVARAYVAIVDPSSDVDFDTIESAYDYAIGKGGGNILITPGEYYLSSIVELDGSVNFVGVDPDTTIIHTDYDNDKYFATGHWDADWSGSFFVRDITFIADSAYCFLSTGPNDVANSTMIITGCTFKGAGGYLTDVAKYMNVSDVVFYVTAIACFGSQGNSTLSNVIIRTTLTTGTVYFLDGRGDNEVAQLLMTNVTTDGFFGVGSGFRFDFFNGNSLIWSTMINCRIDSLKGTYFALDSSTVLSCQFNLAGTEVFTVYLGRSSFLFSQIYNGAAANFAPDSGSIYYTILGNQITGYSGTLPTGGIMEGNLSYLQFKTLATSATAMDLLNNEVAQLTPTSTRTLTTTVPPAGVRRTIIILTSGTTSYTLTFGTGFKTTGTLATGATSARRFVIEFVSDGTQLIETSRTVAIA